MTRRREHQAARTRSTKLASSRRPSGAAAFGVELDAEQRVARDRRHERATVVGRGQDRRARAVVVGHARRTSGRSRSRRRPRCRRRADAAASARPGSSRCAGGSARPRSGPSARRTTPSVVAPSSSLPSNRSCRPRQMPRNGRPAAIQARIGPVRPRRSSRPMAGSAAPTPGTTSASAPTQRRPRSRASVDVGADGGQRLVDADEVAGAVVDDGDPGPRASSERALGRGHALATRVDLAGDPERAAERLEGGLGQVMVVAAGARAGGASRRRSARRPRARARPAGAAGRRRARRGTAGR